MVFLPRVKRCRLLVAAFVSLLLLMLATPRVPQFPTHHVFADMRNIFGVPNTMNVITNFPFLVVGVFGLVLCLHGNYFCMRLRWEMWCWLFFYGGMSMAAFGSAYYHLKPEDCRVLWDRLPLMVAFTSLFTSFVIERVDERLGFTCFLTFLIIVFITAAYERFFNDVRLYMMFHLVPCVAIPSMKFISSPKYTHSRYWLYAAGFYILAKFEASADKKIYDASRYIISGHSLEHLCMVVVPLLLTTMLLSRSVRSESRCNEDLVMIHF